MTIDREHIAMLEQLLAKTQKHQRTCKDQLRQYHELNVAELSKVDLRRTIEVCRGEAEAIEWALEKLTRSER